MIYIVSTQPSRRSTGTTRRSATLSESNGTGGPSAVSRSINLRRATARLDSESGRAAGNRRMSLRVGAGPGSGGKSWGSPA